MTSFNKENPEELTGVSDVRRVREMIARQHHGDISAHIEETSRIAQPILKHLGIKLVPPLLTLDAPVQKAERQKHRKALPRRDSVDIRFDPPNNPLQ